MVEDKRSCGYVNGLFIVVSLSWRVLKTYACSGFKSVRLANVLSISYRHEGASVWVCAAPCVSPPTEEISTPPASEVPGQVQGQWWANLWHLLRGLSLCFSKGPWQRSHNARIPRNSSFVWLVNGSIWITTGFDSEITISYSPLGGEIQLMSTLEYTSENLSKVFIMLKSTCFNRPRTIQDLNICLTFWGHNFLPAKQSALSFNSWAVSAKCFHLNWIGWYLKSC